MSIKNVIPLNEAEACRCGRTALKPHCPSCGSFSLYCFSKSDTAHDSKGHEVEIKRFRCQRCGVHFDSRIANKLRCEAPLFVYENMKERRKEDKLKEVIGKIAKEQGRETAVRVLFESQGLAKKKPSDAELLAITEQNAPALPTESLPDEPVLGDLTHEETSTVYKDEFFGKEE